VQYYHSRTPKYGNKYLQHVRKSWGAISGKIRTALKESDETSRPRKSYRVVEVKDADGGNSSGEVKISSLAPRKTAMSLRPNDGSSSGFGMRLRDVDRLSGGFKKPTMRDIRVTSVQKSPENVMVIRPARKQAEVAKEAAAQPQPSSVTTTQDLFISEPQQPTKTAAEVAQKTENTVQKRKTEPKFVFVE
jgi:hypothetical protein